nr:MAG TPA: hypothetical protein [Caudoviricetes sp.]
MIHLSPGPARDRAGVTTITAYNYGGLRLWQI